MAGKPAVSKFSSASDDKIARCLFADCARIEDKVTVSVQSIESSASKML
jgi:hypothetical protein